MRSRAPAGTQRSAPSPLEPCGLVRGGVRPHGREVDVLPPSLLELACDLHSLVPGLDPRIVAVGFAPLRVRAVQDEGTNPLRVGRRKEHRHGTTLRIAEDRRGLAPDRVHHGTDVVHACLEVRQPDVAVRQPGATLVEPDQSSEGPEPLVQPSGRRELPVDLEVREEAVDQDEVERTVARDLVRDVDVTALGVADRGGHRCDLRKQSTVWSSTMPTVCMNA